MQAFAAVGIPVGLAESQQQHGFLRRRHLQSASVRTMSRDSCMVNSLGGRLRDARAPRRPASFFTGLQVVVLLAYCRFASAVICAAERPGAQRVTSWLKHDPIGLAQPRAAPPGETAGNEIYSIRSLRGGSANDAKDGTADATSKEEMEKMERDKVLIAQLQAMRRECQGLKKRISTVGEEIDDHKMAAGVIEKFPVSRPCKRAIGGVLIESTTGEVLPALRNEIVLLTKASEDLTAKLRDIEKQMTAFQSKHNIRILSEGTELGS